MKHTKFTQTERELLSQWLNVGVSKKECAKRLKRNIRTIQRELIRNKTRVSIGWNNWEMIYEPNHAHSVAEGRRKNAWLAKEPLKNKKIFSYVLEKLRESWSPEQIAGRLKYEDHPDDKSWHICMETIYQFIYKEKTDKTRQGLLLARVLDKRLPEGNAVATVTDADRPLWEYLRRKQVRRRKKNGRESQRVRIPDRVSIHERPKAIDERKEFGHWEGDSIVGCGHKNGLHTEYERVASMTRFERLKRVSADEAATH